MSESSSQEGAFYMGSVEKKPSKLVSVYVHADERTEESVESEVRAGKIDKKRLKKKKPKVKPLTPLERVHAGKIRVKNHYFSAGRLINEKNERDFFKEISPFAYPKDLEEFSYKVLAKTWEENLTRKELRYSVKDKNNYRTRQNLDILNRMFVREPDPLTIHTILELDPNYFSIIEGRPLIERFFMREYIRDVRDVLRTKLICGYRQDDIRVIDENFLEEQRVIDDIKQKYQTYVDSFEEFLFDDHTSSMNLLRRAEEEATKAMNKYDEYVALSKEFGNLKYTVYNLEDKWRNCKMFQKFLYTLSPIYWRRKHDYYHLQDRGSHLSLVEEDVETNKEQDSGSGEEPSLENLIQKFLDDITKEDKPLLFFEEPNQLLKVFRFIEMQNLNTLLHTEELAVPTENVREGIVSAKLVFETEMGKMKDIIDGLEGGIIWEEERADYLKALALELINVDFRRLVANDEALSLYVFVEDVYESHVAPNDANIGLGDMMKAIEIKYRHYTLALDMLPQEQVRKAENECFADLAKNLKIAEVATKKVMQVARLTRRLKRALEPPFKRYGKELRNRSPPPQPIKHPPPPPRALTTEESDYLTYFTEFCKYTDKIADYGIQLVNDKQDQRKRSLRISRPSITSESYGDDAGGTLETLRRPPAVSLPKKFVNAATTATAAELCGLAIFTQILYTL